MASSLRFPVFSRLGQLVSLDSGASKSDLRPAVPDLMIGFLQLSDSKQQSQTLQRIRHALAKQSITEPGQPFRFLLLLPTGVVSPVSVSQERFVKFNECLHIDEHGHQYIYIQPALDNTQLTSAASTPSTLGLLIVHGAHFGRVAMLAILFLFVMVLLIVAGTYGDRPIQYIPYKGSSLLTTGLRPVLADFNTTTPTHNCSSNDEEWISPLFHMCDKIIAVVSISVDGYFIAFIVCWRATGNWLVQMIDSYLAFLTVLCHDLLVWPTCAVMTVAVGVALFGVVKILHTLFPEGAWQ